MATKKGNLTRKGTESATICRCSSSFYSLYINENVYERIQVNTFSAISDGAQETIFLT